MGCWGPGCGCEEPQVNAICYELSTGRMLWQRNLRGSNPREDTRANSRVPPLALVRAPRSTWRVHDSVGIGNQAVVNLGGSFPEDSATGDSVGHLAILNPCGCIHSRVRGFQTNSAIDNTNGRSLAVTADGTVLSVGYPEDGTGTSRSDTSRHTLAEVDLQGNIVGSAQSSNFLPSTTGTMLWSIGDDVVQRVVGSAVHRRLTRDGDLVWTLNLFNLPGGWLNQSGALVAVDGDRGLFQVTTGPGGVWAFDLQTGLLDDSINKLPYSVTAARTLDVGGAFFVRNTDPSSVFARLDSETLDTEWSIPTSTYAGTVLGVAVAAQGVVILMYRENLGSLSRVKLRAVDAATGSPLWQEWCLTGVNTSAAVLSSGRLIVTGLLGPRIALSDRINV